MVYRPLTSIPCLPLSTWAPCCGCTLPLCSSDMPQVCLPQDLCTCCSHGLSGGYWHGWILSIPQNPPQMLSLQRVFHWPPSSLWTLPCYLLCTYHNLELSYSWHLFITCLPSEAHKFCESRILSLPFTAASLGLDQLPYHRPLVNVW